MTGSCINNSSNDDCVSGCNCEHCIKICEICGAVAERCHNPGEIQLVAQTEYWNEVMKKHRCHGDELFWFARIEAIRQYSRF